MTDNGAAHQIDQTLGDGQTQAGAFDAGGNAAVFPFKGFEQMLQEFFAHANAVILDGAAVGGIAIFLFQLFHRIDNLSAGGGVFDGIADQVQFYLVHLQIIEESNAILHMAMHFQRQVFALQILLEDVFDIAQGIGNIVGLQVQFLLAAFDAGQVQYIIDKLEQVLAGNMDFIQIVADFFRVIHVFFCQGGKPDDGIQGGADIVGHIKEEGTLGAVGTFGGLLGLLQFGGSLHVLIDAPCHGNAVHIAGHIFH